MYEFINNTMRKAAEIMLEADDISSKVKVKPGDANFVTAHSPHSPATKTERSAYAARYSPAVRLRHTWNTRS